jgi:hypothetical protein
VTSLLQDNSAFFRGWKRGTPMDPDVSHALSELSQLLSVDVFTRDEMVDMLKSLNSTTSQTSKEKVKGALKQRIKTLTNE